MQNAPFTKAINKKLFDLPKQHPKLGKVKEYEKSNSKKARNTKRQNSKPVKKEPVRASSVKRKRFNSQQFRSSSPLLQCRCPSHRFFNKMHWPLLHRNHSLGQVFDAKRHNIMNYQWFCAYYRITC